MLTETGDVRSFDAADHGAVLEGLGTFVDQVVVPLEETHRELLEEPSRLHDSSGGYSEEVQCREMHGDGMCQAYRSGPPFNP